MKAIEVWRTAGDLVARQGAEGAVFHAARQADRSQTEGDSERAREWLLVIDAIEEIVRPAGACEYMN